MISMDFTLIKKGFFEKDVVQDGNTFLLGNGHIGYRGTLEEFAYDKLTGLNLVGVYDKCQDKWRESVNTPNPFYVQIFDSGGKIDPFCKAILDHEARLHYREGYYERKTEYPNLTVSSTRFVSVIDRDCLYDRMVFKAKEDMDLTLEFGIEKEIYEINGPHFKTSESISKDGCSLFFGTTNEGKTLGLYAQYPLSKGKAEADSNGRHRVGISLKKGETLTLTMQAKVYEGSISEEEFVPFDRAFDLQKEAFRKQFDVSNIIIDADDPSLQETLSYSIYHLLILGDPDHARSIPARGLSGQTYKGAVFWDTEIFLLPFFTLTDPKVARRLIEYRIKTLKGAKAKANEYGYEGAFYAWESQDDGKEACSKYNVIDVLTHQPVRTYFNEKQIHISADIPYAMDRYIAYTHDETILAEGGYDILIETSKFFMSYASLGGDGLYHFKDVIGPDEYHERVNDNAFTNYMIEHSLRIASKHLGMDICDKEHQKYAQMFAEFADKIYLPKPNAQGVIESFDGYFQLEDVTVPEVRSRLRDPQDYWGGPNGAATKTQVIKQADVIALLALLPDRFSNDVKKANYDYYFPRTEHGSSLSASMHALLGLEIGEEKQALSFFKDSASIDLKGATKLFAGGLYIGGTHPASSGGAYLDAIYGFMGLTVKEDGELEFHPSFPEGILSIQATFTQGNKKTTYTIRKMNHQYQQEANEYHD